MTDRSDAELMDALQRALEAVDTPPAHVVAHAQDAFVWQGIDAELAELIYDSQADTATAVRGSDAAREITFRAPGIEIEVMIVSEQQRSIVGQLVPSQDATVDLHQGDDVVRSTTDSLGRFSFDRLRPGAIKLVVVTAAGMRIQTEGLTI